MTYIKEALFQKKVKLRLDAIAKKEKLWYFVKEAASLRGLPDLIGCYNGRFFAMELKKSPDEAEKKTGRIVLQKYILQQIDKSLGLGYLVHPDNVEEVFEDLNKRCAQKLLP